MLIALCASKGDSIMGKPKSKNKDDARKLASDHGRAKAKSGGEPHKETNAGTAGRAGSSKHRKG